MLLTEQSRVKAAYVEFTVNAIYRYIDNTIQRYTDILCKWNLKLATIICSVLGCAFLVFGSFRYWISKLFNLSACPSLSYCLSPTLYDCSFLSLSTSHTPHTRLSTFLMSFWAVASLHRRLQKPLEQSWRRSPNSLIKIEAYALRAGRGRVQGDSGGSGVCAKSID